MSQIVELGSNSRRNVSQDRMCQQDDLQLSSRYLEKQCYKICIHFSSFFFFFFGLESTKVICVLQSGFEDCKLIAILSLSIPGKQIHGGGGYAATHVSDT